jgi:heat shock protein HslJ
VQVRFAEGGRVTGFSGVNRFNAQFQSGEKGSIQWGPGGAASTRMAGPPEAMGFEARFLKALMSTTRLVSGPAGVELISEGKVKLVFSQERNIPGPFAGVELRLVVMKPAPPAALPAERPVTITVRPDGSVSGFASVNRYFGSLRIGEGGAIQPGGRPFGSTMMAGPKDLMDLESSFLKALASATRIELNANGLTLSNDDRTTELVFEKR